MGQKTETLASDENKKICLKLPVGTEEEEEEEEEGRTDDKAHAEEEAHLQKQQQQHPQPVINRAIRLQCNKTK